MGSNGKLSQTIGRLLLNSILCILLGILFIVIKPELVLNVAFITIGVIMILSGVIELISTDNKTFSITSVITIALGASIIIFRNNIAAIIVGVILIALPIVRIILSPKHFEQFKLEIINLVIGLILLICGPTNVIEIIFKIIGILLIVGAIIYLIMGLVIANKKPVKKSDVIDAEYEVKE